MRLMMLAALLALATAYDPCNPTDCDHRCAKAADPDACVAACEKNQEPGGGHTP